MNDFTTRAFKRRWRCSAAVSPPYCGAAAVIHVPGSVLIDRNGYEGFRQLNHRYLQLKEWHLRAIDRR